MKYPQETDRIFNNLRALEGKVSLLYPNFVTCTVPINKSEWSYKYYIIIFKINVVSIYKKMV